MRRAADGARIRLPGAAEPDTMEGNLEILTLCGTTSRDGVHMQISVADGEGLVTSGLFLTIARFKRPPSQPRVARRLILALLPERSHTRELDTNAAYSELVVRSEA